MEIIAWDKKTTIAVAVLVDVDGTLVGPYINGTRELRSSAIPALQELSRVAPVFLWSIVGAENGERLLNEFPEASQYISGCYGKEDFPIHLVKTPYAIDDDGIDDCVLRCNHIILGQSYSGGKDNSLLLNAVNILVNHLASMQI